MSSKNLPTHLHDWRAATSNDADLIAAAVAEFGGPATDRLVRLVHALSASSAAATGVQILISDSIADCNFCAREGAESLLLRPNPHTGLLVGHWVCVACLRRGDEVAWEVEGAAGVAAEKWGRS
jgi:hypothetical protein